MKSSTTAAAALLAAAVTLPVWAQDEFGDESYNDAAAEETAEPQESAAADEAPSEGTATDSYEDSAALTELAQADAGDSGDEAGFDDGSATEGDDASNSDSADAYGTETDAGDGSLASDFAPSDGSTDDGSSETGESVSGASYAEESYATDSYGDESGETAEADEEPGHFYVGVDRARVTLSFSDPNREAQFGGAEPRSDFYRVRVGTRLFDAIGLEGHYAIADSKDDEQDRFEVDKSYGVYLVPTGVILDVLEIAVPVGYNVFSAKRGQAETELDGVSYGINFEIPVVISESMPELRLGGGGMVYQAHERHRVYGYHFGVRLDFTM